MTKSEDGMIRFALRMSLGSLVKFSSFIGFCHGTVSIPIMIVLNHSGLRSDSAAWISVPAVMVGAPVIGALNGGLVGLLGYPVYKWLTNRIAITYTGWISVRGEE